jgi:hypothetical protein
MSSPTKPTKAILIKNPYGEFQDVKVALGRTLRLNLFDAFYGPTSIFDIYWIDWDVIKNAPADDFQLSALWTWGMHVTEKTLLWRSFDSFRQQNASFSVLGYPIRSFFRDIMVMRAYSYDGDETRPLFNAQGLRREGYGSNPKYTTPDIPEHHDHLSHDLELVVNSLIERKLATTETGYLALVPGSASVGDVVAILYGCNFPVVLRPKGDMFLYIGECYVDGVMNGEVWDAKEKGEYKEVEITIC